MLLNLRELSAIILYAEGKSRFKANQIYLWRSYENSKRIFQKNNVHPKVIYEATNEKMIASMVASGMGISIMPRIQEISIYPVVPITIENHALRRSLYMFWNENIFQPPIVARFRKFVMETLRI